MMVCFTKTRKPCHAFVLRARVVRHIAPPPWKEARARAGRAEWRSEMRNWGKSFFHVGASCPS